MNKLVQVLFRAQSNYGEAFRGLSDGIHLVVGFQKPFGRNVRLAITLVKGVLLGSAMLQPLEAKARKALLQGSVFTRHGLAKLLVVEVVGVQAAGNV